MKSTVMESLRRGVANVFEYSQVEDIWNSMKQPSRQSFKLKGWRLIIVTGIRWDPAFW